MDDVENLVIKPFQELVNVGNTAVENAGDFLPMLKAAQNLTKEGERALKRLQPICKKNFDEYGRAFVNEVRENDEIGGYRSQLDDLIWEFEDYLELDSFDADKFAELQALSRKAAPKIYEIIIRMKLDSLPHFENHFISQLSPPSSPQPPPTFPLPSAPPTRGSMSSSQTERRSLAEVCTVEDATEQLSRIISEEGNHRIALESSQPPVLPPLQITRPLLRPPSGKPPPPPSANPWDYGVQIANENLELGEETNIRRRPAVEMPPSPISMDYETRSFVSRRPITRESGSSGSNFDSSSHYSDDRRQSSSSQNSSFSFSPSQTSRTKVASLNPSWGPSIPEETFGDRSPEDFAQSPKTQYSLPSYYKSRHESIETDRGDTSGGFGYDAATNAQESEFRDRFPSVAESLVHADPDLVITDSASDRPASVVVTSQPGLELVRGAPVMPTLPLDTGLIPVESEIVPPRTPHSSLSQRYSSIEADSSFYAMNGFCEGAREVRRGGAGVKKTMKPVGFTTAATVARCTNCLYEHDFKDIEHDVNRMDQGNYSRNNIGYRLRFLQKSHVHAKRLDDTLYGCVFCVQAGRTIDESDATVFPSSQALFSHLARHPRPLPRVLGITVVDQAEIPPEFHNNYDVHFRGPPEPHPTLEKATDIARLPSGVAKETARRVCGQKLLPDKTPALEMMQGARITGLTWPSRYNGEWCFGWHDGVHASVPTDLVRLDRPPRSDLKMPGTSRIQAKSQWKFAPKDKEKGDWLKFDKNEVITNISWAYPEHWCWSGTNSKGKWGIFPQAFIDTNTVQEPPVNELDRAKSVENEKGRSLSILPRRRASGRPRSIAESTSSNETTKRLGFLSSRSLRSGGDNSSR